MARNGLYSSIGCRSSGGRLSWTIVGTGGSVLADGPCADLSRQIQVLISLTFATKVSLVFDDAICRVFHRMLLSSSSVSVETTVQGPRVFSLNFHPKRSSPASEDGRCRVETVSGIFGAAEVLCGFSAMNFFEELQAFQELGLGVLVLSFSVGDVM
jgi:hypothetical protein